MINHVPSSKTIKAKKSLEREELEGLYQNVRDIRKGKVEEALPTLFTTLKSNHPNDWLLSVEIIEVLKHKNEPELLEEVLIHLEHLKHKRPEIAHLISGGLELIFKGELV